MNTGLERRLERLEAQQPRVAAMVAIARRWAAEWDRLGPRVAATVALLRAKRTAGVRLEPLEERVLGLVDNLVSDTGRDAVAAVHGAVVEVAS